MSGISASSETATAPNPKRRKVRKGTQSCWECKRRKIRCTFVVVANSTCDGCRSRRVKCISQQFYNETELGSSNTNRLSRVEAVVEQLAKRVDSAVTNLPSYHMRNAQTKTMPRLDSDISFISAPSTTPTPVTGITPNIDVRNKGRHDKICGALLEAWPSQSELDLIFSAPVGISTLLHGTLCMPYSKFLDKEMPLPQEILQLPPPGSHPVLIARKLLMLGSFLQGLPRVVAKDLGRLGLRHQKIKSRVVEAASRLVNCNDDIVDSLEGIECIMIESMYQNNAGSLRHAWLLNRRGMALAQMMGLHRGGPHSPKLLDVETQNRINPEYMWLRLITTDRYLSLILGLPQGSPESLFTAPGSLERCAPMERMDRIEATVGGLIIQRNGEDLRNLATTRQIDQLLQDAAATMPAQWWLVPDVDSHATSDPNTFRETLRISSHFAHFHLLAQCHLPCLLQSSADWKYEYNKITAVNASREILLRFVRYTGSSTVTAYCRGIDFIAFVASTTMCLAHIIARRQYRSDMNGGAGLFQSLVHQRFGDRGLMERTLQRMEEMAHVENDPVASRIAAILQRLLAVDAAAANGGCYDTCFRTGSSAQEFQSGDNDNESSGTLSINIPHLGTIIFEPCGVMRYPEVARGSLEETVMSRSTPKPSSSGTRLCIESESLLNLARHQAVSEGISPANPPAEQVNEQAPPSDLDSIRPADESRSTAINNSFFDVADDRPVVGSPLPPNLAADFDEWALQGVDMALFDNLFEEQATWI